MVNLRLAFLLALALAATANAAVPSVPASCNLTDGWDSAGSSWVSIVFTGILVVMLFLSLAYMCGVAFMRIDWIVWAKDEFYQILISVAIVLLVTFLINSGCQVSYAIAGGSPFSVSEAYINTLMWEKALKISTDVFMAGVFASFLSSITMHAGVGFSPLAGLKTVTVIMDFLFLAASTFFSSLMLQLILLKVSEAIMLKVVLAFGIIFRVFPFLRHAGAFLIALALGFYFVYPLMYVVNSAIMEHIVPDDLPYEQAGTGMPDSLTSLLAFTGSSTPDMIVQTLLPMTSVQRVANLLPQALFLPLLNLAVTLGFIKSMTKILSHNFPSPFS